MENNNNSMDKNRKIALIILSVFSITIIVIWGLNFNSSLRDPFSYQGDLIASNKNNCVDGNCAVGEMTSDNLELKNIDTDGDGISDWDELFIHGTSPYLEDTDGDTLSDYEEIFVYKTNANCPEGQDCSNSLSQSTSQNSGSSEASNDFYDFLTSLETSVEQDVNSTSSNSSMGNSSEKVDAQSLRQILIQSGIEESDLEQINDDDLMKLYQEVLADL